MGSVHHDMQWKAWSTILLATALVAATVPMLWIEPAGGPPAGVKPDAVDPEEPAPDVSPVAEPVGDAVSGQVLWPDGIPFEQGTISLKRVGAEDWEDPVGEAEGGAGRFRFAGLEDGSYDLVVTYGEYRHHSCGVAVIEAARFTLRPGDTDCELRIPAPRAKRIVDLVVVGPVGRPVSRGRAILDEYGCFNEPGGREVRIVNGRARCFLEVPARLVAVTVHRAEDADGKSLGRTMAGPFEVGSGPIEIRLPAGRTIEGRVVSPDGELPAWVGVHAWHPPTLFAFYGGWDVGCCGQGWERVGADGRFRLTHLGPGAAVVAVRLARRRFEDLADSDRWLDAYEVVVPAGETEVEVVLRKGVWPEIRIDGPDGTPVTEAEVEIRQIGLLGHPWRKFREKVRLRDGVARFGPLDPDKTCTLIVRPSREDHPGLDFRRIDDWFPADTTVRLSPSEPEEKLPPEPQAPDAATLRLTIDHGCGDTLSSIDGEIVAEGTGEARWVRVDPDEPVIGGLDPDECYTVRFAGVGPGLAGEATGLRPGPRARRIRLEEGLSISGRLHLPPGTTRASVHAKRGALFVEDAVIHRDGRFEIHGLLPGTWKADAWAWAGVLPYEGEAEAVADGSAVRVTLHPQRR